MEAVCADVAVKPKTAKDWMLVAEVNQSKIGISRIANMLQGDVDIMQLVNADIEEGSKRLFALNCASDGIQLTADKLRNTRHFSNTLFITTI